MQFPKSFYKTHDLYKFANKNVVYIAYVGKYNEKPVYKYGISSNIYQREYQQHRKNFDEFTMCWIKKTCNMAQAEDMFEKELKIRNLHTTMTINRKRQTELFVPTEEYPYEYLKRLFNRLTKHADKDLLSEIAELKRQLKEKNKEIEILKGGGK